jgi:hypothetical protein
MKFAYPVGPAHGALIRRAAGTPSRLVLFVSLLVALLFCLRPAFAVQLLPGVYGYGLDRANNPGGFAHPTLTPQVIHVTTVADNGSNASPTAGSLRAAIVASGPRIVVFDVSGIIDLKANLTIANPYITIAGQTAPSPGISIHGATLAVTASNVLVQHVRVRPGDRWLPGPNNHDRDTVRVGKDSATPVNNVVFDHCTFAWALDETASLWYAWDSVTFNQCLFAEPLATSIHLDEHTLANNEPVDGEDLTPTPATVVTSTQSDTNAVSGAHRLLSFATQNEYADFTINVVADSGTRLNEHLVVAGLTGPNRGKFKAQVRLTPGGSVIQEDEFDQYAPSGQEQLKSFVLKADVTGFSIPAAATPLYVRLISTGMTGSSRQISVDVLSLSQAHAMGPLFGNGGSLTGTYGRVAIIGSVFASIMERSPWIGSRDFVFANNVLYNRKKKFLHLGATNWDTTIRAAAVGNTFIEGPTLQSSPVEPILLERLPAGGIQLYATDNDYNKGGGGTTDTVEAQFTTTGSIATNDPTDQGNGLAGFQPLPHAQAYETAMFTAGARPYDRDDFESRIFDEITTGAVTSSYTARPGSLKNSVADAGGWPFWASTSALWTAPSSPNTDPDGNGYTRIEEWLQGLSNQLTGLIAPTTTDALLATFDTFTDGNANGWTPLGNTEWSITSGAYRQSANVEWARAVSAGTNWTNQVVQAKIKPLSFNGSNRFIALLARQRDVNNFYYVSMRNAPTNAIEIKKSVNGIATVIGSSYAFTPSIGTQYTLRLEVSGSSPVTLKAYLNGSLIINTQDASPPAQLASGRAAIGTYYATADFDDFFASPLPSDVPQVMSDFDTGSTAGWTPAAPTNVWVASSGVYHCNDNTVVAPRTLAGTNASAQTVQADVKIISTSTTDRFAAIYARYTDVNNCYYLLLRKDQNKVELKKLSGGAQTLIDDDPQTVSLNQWSTLRLEVSGSNPVQLKGYVNGVLRVQGTDSGTGLAAGQAALGTNLAAADFDDVIVTSP